MSSGLRPDEWRRKAMSYLNFFARFRRDQSGAVTVDWVVLTAALVGIAVSPLCRPCVAPKSSPKPGFWPASKWCSKM